MDCIHIKLTESLTIEFDVKHDSYKCLVPFGITFHFGIRNFDQTFFATPKKIKDTVRKIEAKREDCFVDCTDQGECH